MKTTLLAVVVLLSAISCKPKEDDLDGIVDYIVSNINSGNVEEVESYVVDRKDFYLRTNPGCSGQQAKEASDWSSRCNPDRIRTRVLSALRMVSVKYGKCVRTREKEINEGLRYRHANVKIKCGNMVGSFMLNKYVTIDPNSTDPDVRWVPTKYWNIDTDIFLWELLRPILK